MADRKTLAQLNERPPGDGARWAVGGIGFGGRSRHMLIVHEKMSGGQETPVGWRFVTSACDANGSKGRELRGLDTNAVNCARCIKRFRWQA